MQHTFRDTDEADAEIACFETEDGLMTLQIDGRDFKLSKARFIGGVIELFVINVNDRV